jgi:hypothetical protein
MSVELPPEILVMIEDTVDKYVRCYRPPAALVFRRVKHQCRREGWALNKAEERELLTAAWEYTHALRRRTRQPRLIGNGR